MHFFGHAIKYLLWSLFSIIVFVLFVGWAKMDWDIGSYIAFLNTSNWSSFVVSQPATWTVPFWSHASLSGDINDMLSDDSLESELSGLDVYDPALEAELNAFTDPTLSGNVDEDFGFTTTGETHNSADASSSDVTSSTSKAQLLNLIKQRELTK